MKHYLINLSWRCQNRCSYCWVRQTVLKRPELAQVRERTLEEWLAAIRRDTPDIIDIAGGEPLLVLWLPALIRECAPVRFGLSSNGRDLRALERLLCQRMPNLIGLTLSYHPESADPDLFKAAVEIARKYGQPLSVNVVDAGTNREAARNILAWCEGLRVPLYISPYERMDTLSEIMPTGLCCKGGEQHLTIAPNGDAWPCLTTLRSPFWQETCLGNWVDGTLDMSRKAQPCHLNCVDYYILPEQHQAGDMWGIEAKPCE